MRMMLDLGAARRLPDIPPQRNAKLIPQNKSQREGFDSVEFGGKRPDSNPHSPNHMLLRHASLNQSQYQPGNDQTPSHPPE